MERVVEKKDTLARLKNKICFLVTFVWIFHLMISRDFLIAQKINLEKHPSPFIYRRKLLLSSQIKSIKTTTYTKNHHF